LTLVILVGIQINVLHISATTIVLLVSSNHINNLIINTLYEH